MCANGPAIFLCFLVQLHNFDNTWRLTRLNCPTHHSINMPVEELPEGWRQMTSRSTGKPYYFNETTGQTRWEKPTESAVATADDCDGPRQVRASHLLVKHRDSRRPSSWREEHITRTKDQAIEELNKYIAMIESGEATFEDLASKYSDCSSAKRGGDLGFFERRQMQKPFEDAAFGLDIGSTSSIVETDSGVHIIMRTG